MDQIIQVLADIPIVFILGIGGVILLRLSPALKTVWYPRIIMAGLTSLLLAKFTSILWQPSSVRPFLEQGTAAGAIYIDNPGFPSDHALLATVMVLAVYAATRRDWLSLSLAALTIVMCVARVLALVHTPLDIAGGIAFALLGALWYRGGRHAAARLTKPSSKPTTKHR